MVPMRVLVINCGNSSLKFELIDTAAERAGSAAERRLARGVIERIGGQARLDFVAHSSTYQDTTSIADHEQASRRVLDWLDTAGFLAPGGLEAVGHRVVHGGHRFVEPVRLDDTVIAAIDALHDLAPLHNDPAVAAIRAVRAILDARVPMVAVFDTAFHHTMPAWAAQYAIPRDLTARYHIRRYGFHGLAHRYMSACYALTSDLSRFSACVSYPAHVWNDPETGCIITWRVCTMSRTVRAVISDMYPHSPGLIPAVPRARVIGGECCARPLQIRQSKVAAEGGVQCSSRRLQISGLRRLHHRASIYVVASSSRRLAVARWPRWSACWAARSPQTQPGARSSPWPRKVRSAPTRS